MKSTFIFLVLLAFILFPAEAQDITGNWYALLKGPELHLNLHIRTDGYKLSGDFDSPDQNAYAISLDSISLTGNQFYFFWRQGGMTYRGRYEEKADLITGSMTQSGVKYKVDFTRQDSTVDWKDTTFIRTQYDKKDVYITMRDGVRLYTSIYSPKSNLNYYPIILTRTPYGIETSETGYPRMLSEYSHFLEEGYIIVLQDVRGRFMSEGTFVDVRPYIRSEKEEGNGRKQ